MKKLTIILILISQNLIAQTNWTLINSNTDNFLSDIDLISNYGYIVGDSGTILKTTDYGSTWANISISNSENINSVSFVNDSVGFFCTQHSIFKTNNFGTSWNTVYNNTNESFFVIKFVSDSIGFIGTENKILRTIDGGLTWQNQQNTGQNIVTISSPSPTTIYFTGTSGYGMIFKTTDQGDSFENYPINFNTIIEDIYFINNNEGFITGWYSPLVLKTINGGATWNYIDTTFEGSFSITSLTNQISYKVDNGGGNSTISSTSNGGNTWNEEFVYPTNGILYGFKKIRSIGNDVIVIGSNGVIYKKQSALNIIDPEQDYSVKLFPNPAQDEINLEIQIPYNKIAIEVIDLNGKTLMKFDTNWSNIDFSNLPNGAYFIKINIDNRLITKKVIKQ
jgi:photosystem II stability/assembly factor-like uncharacterized protein